MALGNAHTLPNFCHAASQLVAAYHRSYRCLHASPKFCTASAAQTAMRKQWELAEASGVIPGMT